MNSKAWDFLAVVAVCLLIYFVIKEIIPHVKELRVTRDKDGAIDFSAFTHDRTEIADANLPLVLQGQ